MKKMRRMRELPAFFGEHGLKIGYGTIKKMSARGDGPPFKWWNNFKIFEEEGALEWAHQNLTDERRAFNPRKEETTTP